MCAHTEAASCVSTKPPHAPTAPAGRHPVCVLTRDAALATLTAIRGAPITRTMRGIRSEVEVGTAQGLPASSVITCDNVITIPVDSLDDRAVGHLDLRGRAELDRALRARHPILTACPNLV